MIQTLERHKGPIAIADQDLNALRFAAAGTTTLLIDKSFFVGGLLADATSDSAENEVDRMVKRWFDDGIAYVAISIPADFPAGPTVVSDWSSPIAEAAPVADPPVAVGEVARDLREKLDLSVQDLAAMVGISRRRYYDLLEGQRTSFDVENRMSHLQSIVHELFPLLREDPRLLRSAVLMPIGPGRTSLYEAGASRNDEALPVIGEALLERFRSGRIRGLGPRPVPRTHASNRGHRLAREAVEDVPHQQHEKGEGDGGGS